MNLLVKKYNALHGKKVSRKQIQNIIDIATNNMKAVKTPTQKVVSIHKKLSTLLKNNKDAFFEITLSEKTKVSESKKTVKYDVYYTLRSKPNLTLETKILKLRNYLKNLAQSYNFSAKKYTELSEKMYKYNYEYRESLAEYGAKNIDTKKLKQQFTLLEKNRDKTAENLSSLIQETAKALGFSEIASQSLLEVSVTDGIKGFVKELSKFNFIEKSSKVTTKTAATTKKKNVKNNIKPPKVDKNGQFGMFGASKDRDTIAFNKQILKAAKKGYNENDIFYLGCPKLELKKHISDFKITMTGKVLKKVMSQTKDHKVNWSNLIDLPDFVNDPIAIFKSKTTGYVVLTSVMDIENKPLMVVLHINKNYKITKIASVYTRNSMTTYKNWIEDNLHLYINKKSELYPYTQATIAVGGNNSQCKGTKIKPTSKKESKAPTAKNTLNNKFSTPKNRKFFTLKPKFKEVSRFLGKVEIMEKESAVMTLSAGQGAGKTTAFFQLMDAFAGSGYKCLHASLEEHPESYLYEKKVTDLLSKAALANIKAPNYGRKNITDLWKDVKDADVIFIDSMKKLWQYQKGIDLDNDMRKAFNGKLFVIIFQLTSTGKMRGGSDAQFDGDIISFIKKHDNFNENYMYHDKNRYAVEDIAGLKYNISQKGLQGVSTETTTPNFVIVG